MVQVAKPPRREYRRWTAEDTARLRELAAAGATCYAAARAMGRDPKVLKEVALREGIVFALPAPPPPPPPPSSDKYAVTLEEVALLLASEGPLTSEAITTHYGADWRRVNGMLATLLRQARAWRPTERLWALAGLAADVQPSAPPEPVAEVEGRRYFPTSEDLAVLARLRELDADVCGRCLHYTGPLVRPSGGQLRGRCLVLALWVVPQCEDRPCGRGYAAA